MQNMEVFPKQQTKDTLYDARFEHDNCGIGAVCNMKGIKTHATVEAALKIVENLEHRAGKDADGKTGDGVGIMVQISHKFFSKIAQSLNYWRRKRVRCGYVLLPYRRASKTSGYEDV